jgi:hypothetical protein
METYPRGKLNNDDEGATPIAIGIEDKTVIIRFFKPIVWIGMDKFQAIELANTIIEKANSIN